MSYRITKGQLIVECDTQAEFSHVVKVLTDSNVPIPGGPPIGGTWIGGGGGVGQSIGGVGGGGGLLGT